MCGISGFVDYRKNTSLDHLKKMTDVMERRGPDGAGYEIFEKDRFQVGLGHRRLSIIDLSAAGSQPKFYKNLIITFNGEIYNYKAVRKTLKSLGHAFTSNSDTEVILQAFEEWGVDCVDHFHGMFSFCIYDTLEEKLFLFRDRVGVKPLYYYHANDLFLFGSSLYALQAHPRFHKELDNQGVGLYFQYGYIRAPRSIYRNVWKVKPGSYVEFDLTTSKLQQKKYWELSPFFNQKNSTIDYAEACNRLEDVLLESFQLRMVADVDVGIFLSGGIDSSLVTALLQSHSNQKIKTFTIGFEEDTFNETSYAKAIAQRLGTDHTEFICRIEDARNVIFQLPNIYDEPLSAISGLATYLISKVAKEQVKVALSGDGGDETFAGYTSYTRNLDRFKSIQKVPLRKFAASILDAVDPVSAVVNHNSSVGVRYNRFKTVMGLTGYPQMHLLSSSVFTPFDLNKLLNFHFKDQPDLSASYFHSMDPIEQLMLTDAQTYLPDEVLAKVDRASMNASLESREPLLDHKILEFAAQLPIEYKRQKRILKHILGKYIPNELFERKKQGFGLPINSWLRKDLKELVENHLSREKINQTNIFHYAYVRKLKDDFFRRKNNDYRVWNLLVFQMWFEKNF